MSLASHKPIFPDPRKCKNPEGIVALGGNLNPETLLEAYRKGIFPWPCEGYPMLWFCPPERAILKLDKIHIPRSLAKVRRKNEFTFTFNQAFPEVIRSCALAPRPGQEGTWITEELLEAYIELHRIGYGFSVEAWSDNELAGGVYGVAIDGIFSAESMFYRKPSASKLALLHLCDHLRAQGLEWIDIQVMTPHMEALGAELVSRNQFLKMIG